MSEWGVKTGEACSERIFSPDVPKGADIIGAFRHFRVVPKAAVSNRSKADNLFDHLVGAGERGQRHGETKHPRSFRPNERAAETLLVFSDGLDKMS
jgi:hypothetical protein